MLLKIGEETAKITDLITSNNASYIKELGRFLAEADEIRRKVKGPNTASHKTSGNEAKRRNDDKKWKKNKRRKPLKQMTQSIQE